MAHRTVTTRNPSANAACGKQARDPSSVSTLKGLAVGYAMHIHLAHAHAGQGMYDTCLLGRLCTADSTAARCDADSAPTNQGAAGTHATPRHATPRHATPRHVTTRHATQAVLYRARARQRRRIHAVEQLVSLLVIGLAKGIIAIRTYR